MSEQQREPRPQVSVTQQGGSPDGRGEVRMVPEEEVRSYYSRAVLKEPVWSWEIPWYFFAGGLAGASSNLALMARLTGNDKLARRAHVAALGGAAVSPVLLIIFGEAGALLQHAQGLQAHLPDERWYVGLERLRLDHGARGGARPARAHPTPGALRGSGVRPARATSGNLHRGAHR